MDGWVGEWVELYMYLACSNCCTESVDLPRPSQSPCPFWNCNRLPQAREVTAIADSAVAFRVTSVLSVDHPGVVDVTTSEVTIWVGKVKTCFFPLCVSVRKLVFSPFARGQQTFRFSAVRRFDQAITASLHHCVTTSLRTPWAM